MFACLCQVPFYILHSFKRNITLKKAYVQNREALAYFSLFVDTHHTQHTFYLPDSTFLCILYMKRSAYTHFILDFLCVFCRFIILFIILYLINETRRKKVYVYVHVFNFNMYLTYVIKKRALKSHRGVRFHSSWLNKDSKCSRMMEICVLLLCQERRLKENILITEN